MKRQLFCYITGFLELILLTVFALIIIYSYNNQWKLGPYTILVPVVIISLLIMIVPIIFSILFFGTPRNKLKKYKIMKPDINLLDNENTLISYNENNGLWEYNYHGKILEFNLKGWINPRQRIIDILYIQFHNYKFNSNKYPNRRYLKKIINNNIKIKFKKNDKLHTRKFRPSLILKIKMVLAISQFKNSKVPQHEHWERDLYDTFLIVD